MTTGPAAGQGRPPEPWRYGAGRQPPLPYDPPPYDPPPLGPAADHGGPPHPAYGSQQAGYRFAYDQPHGPQAPPPYGPAAQAARPGTVSAACIMAYIGGPFQALNGAGLVIAALVSDVFVRVLTEAAAIGSQDATVAFAVGLGCVMVVMGIAVPVLAVFAQKGSTGARIGLTVLGGVNGLPLLLGLPASIISIGYITVAVVLLWVGRANAWYAAHKTARQAGCTP